VPPFDTGEDAGKLFESRQIMSGHEPINVGKGGSHSFCEERRLAEVSDFLVLDYVAR
jgi:hypothetical protein